MAQTVCVVVDDTDRKQLASIAMDRNRPQKHIQRARIVLLSDEGLAVSEVARQAGVSRPAVWRWQARYAEAGVEALLHDKTRPPGTAKLTTATVAKILALTCSKPPGQVLDVSPTQQEEKFWGSAIHFGIGIIWGPVYSLFRRYCRLRPFGAALASGIAMSLILDEGLVPALGLSAPNQDYSAFTRARGFVAHLVYGATVALAAEGLGRMTGKR